MKLVIYPAVDAERLKRIEAAAGSMRVVNAASPSEARAAIGDADAFFGKLTAELLSASRQLRWVQSPTASLEHYVFEELVNHPLELTNMRGLFSDVIADQVMGYVICFARHLHTYIRNQLTATWAPQGGESARVSFQTGPGVVSDIDRCHQHLSDMSLGVIGFGSIGSEIGRRASAFGMSVRAVDPHPRPSAKVPEVWHLDRLEELLSISDYVVIAAPHTPQTAGLMNARRLACMKPTAYLINIGRGAIVPLNALVEALEQHTIAGAALDVFETEPLPANHPLWRYDNVILTPHVAGYSPRIAERHLQVLLDNIRRFVAGEPLLNVADKAAWY